jgi:predicted nucleic acid-binding protein
MTSAGFDLDWAASAGLLVDTNLLVLYAVGSVNRHRIETFKRTSKYRKADYDLLVRVLAKFKALYTVAHVLAEVSNLTDLPGPERLRIRLVLRSTISSLNEAEMPSARAADDRLYLNLGLVDAAIGAVARAHNCASRSRESALRATGWSDGDARCSKLAGTGSPWTS